MESIRREIITNTISFLDYFIFPSGSAISPRYEIGEMGEKKKVKSFKRTRIICYIVDSKIEFASSRLTCMFDRDIRYFFFFFVWRWIKDRARKVVKSIETAK